MHHPASLSQDNKRRAMRSRSSSGSPPRGGSSSGGGGAAAAAAPRAGGGGVGHNSDDESAWDDDDVARARAHVGHPRDEHGGGGQGRAIDNDFPDDESFVRALERERGWKVQRMAEDGACLFRSVGACENEISPRMPTACAPPTRTPHTHAHTHAPIFRVAVRALHVRCYVPDFLF
jgi:hypothetical protein